jgi:phenylalanyl-tRNA synthetase alpha subunit
MAKKQSKVRPVEEVRFGNIKSAIWRNESQNGPWFNVTLQRLYRNEDGEWTSTTSFGRDDLLLLAKVVNFAHSRVLELLAKERAATAPAKPAA